MNRNEDKKINFLLYIPIDWQKKSEENLWSAIVKNEQCTLKMNDFPDEYLYTLIWKNIRINFDDAPSCWNIPYK